MASNVTRFVLLSQSAAELMLRRTNWELGEIEKEAESNIRLERSEGSD